MFTTKEKKNLTKLLSRVVDPDEAFNLEELHGFFFGLAIIPDLVKPSEWLPVAFGEEMMEFESNAEAEELMGHLFSICNRLYTESHDGNLLFPFDIATIKKGDLLRIRDWTYGLYVSLSLRSEVWGFKDRDEENVTEDEQELTTSFGIIIAVANPEHIPEIFEKEDHDPATNENDLELEGTLFAMLPSAVATVQAFASDLWKNHLSSLQPFNRSMPRQTKKIRRNDPCPCGSGKKYKKCCGIN